MKKLFLLLVTLTVTAAASVAQTKTEARPVTQNANIEPAREYANALKKELDLNDAQTEKVYTARLHSLQKNNRIEKAFASDAVEMKKQKTDVQRDFETTMASILTADQFKAWDKK